MSSTFRNSLTASLLAAAAIMTTMEFPAAAHAQVRQNPYWRNHWRWYDSTYHPYYHRRSSWYVPPLPPNDPRVTGSYGPNWGPYFGGTVAYGPGIQYGWW